MTQAKKKFQPLTSSDVCLAYKFLLDKGLVSFPIPADGVGKVESLVQNILGMSFGVPHYSSVEEKAVAYLYFIIKDHAFTDGNKRTGSFVFSILCDLNGLRADYTHFTLDQLAVFIEHQKEEDHHGWIRVIALALFKVLTDD